MEVNALLQRIIHRSAPNVPLYDDSSPISGRKSGITLSSSFVAAYSVISILLSLEEIVVESILHRQRL